MSFEKDINEILLDTNFYILLVEVIELALQNLI